MVYIFLKTFSIHGFQSILPILPIVAPAQAVIQNINNQM